MNTNRFQIITPRDLEAYHDLAGEITEASWPEFMLHDPIANKNWHELFDRFEEYQFAMLDTETRQMAAMGNSLPFHWDKEISELPEGGWDWALAEAVNNHKQNLSPNMQCAIQVVIRAEYQGHGLSTKVLKALRGVGESKGLKHLIVPVRPSEKSKYPLINIDDYIKWENEEGLPFDAWLRVHVRLGGRIIKTCHKSKIIRGTRTEWEQWTQMKFPQSGEYSIPGALNPIQMNIEKDEGVYVEPNVWMSHESK